MRKRAGEPGFSDAVSARDQQRLTALDPLAVAEAGDEPGVEAVDGAGVEIFLTRLTVFEPCLGREAGQMSTIAMCVERGTCPIDRTRRGSLTSSPTSCPMARGSGR